MSSMSDSWISWNPRMDEPSKPNPSSKASSVNSDAGMEKCCIKPGRSQNRTSTTAAPESLISLSVSLGLAIQILLRLETPWSIGDGGCRAVTDGYGEVKSPG